MGKVISELESELINLATSVFRARREQNQAEVERLSSPYFLPDPLSRAFPVSLSVSADLQPLVERTMQRMIAEPDLSVLANENGLGPMVLHAGGGIRTSAAGIVTALLSEAFLQMYFLRLPSEEDLFVRRVLENLGELRRAIKGEKVHAHLITGISGIRLANESKVTTPWGFVLPVETTPATEHLFFPFGPPEASCALVGSRLMTVKFDRAPQPQHDFDATEIDTQRVTILFPLAFALALDESTEPTVPIITWSTLLLPFHIGF